MHENVFQRVEKKYMLDSVTYRTLMLRIGDRLIPDAYGRYTVGNLYFDTPDWLLARRSIEQPPFKEKLRLRGYGIPAPGDRVFLELKRKVDGVVYKRRESMTLSQAEQYLKTGRHFGGGQIWNELDYFMRLYRPAPGVYLAYDRRAFTGREEPTFRITFDTGVRSRTDKLRLGAGDWGAPLLKDGDCLMEIKAAGAMPLWLAHALGDLCIYPESFSKYGCVYKASIANRKANIQERRTIVCV